MLFTLTGDFLSPRPPHDPDRPEGEGSGPGRSWRRVRLAADLLGVPWESVCRIVLDLADACRDRAHGRRIGEVEILRAIVRQSRTRHPDAASEPCRLSPWLPRFSEDARLIEGAGAWSPESLGTPAHGSDRVREPSHADAAELADFKSMVRRLPLEHRAVFMLTDVLGLSLNDAALATERHIRTCRQMKHEARLALVGMRGCGGEGRNELM